MLGGRQVGKSTLLEQVAAAEGGGRELVTLDHQPTRAAALADSAGFVAALRTPVAIDEVQRAPELMTEIKLRVDRDKTPGQFAIRGSANLLEVKQVKESLAGRAEYLRLHPFSQGELLERPESFIPDLAAGRFPAVFDAEVGRHAQADILAKGGYPEVQRRPPNRRGRFFETYIDGILDKDLVTLGDVADRASVARLLTAIGAVSSAELNVDGLSRDMSARGTTLRRRLDLLETLFLIRRLPAWSNSLLARSIRRPKIHVADTGLLAALIGADERRIASDLDLGGMFYETFVAAELERQLSWLDDRPRMCHFRDRDQREVDIVLEHRDGLGDRRRGQGGGHRPPAGPPWPSAPARQPRSHVQGRRADLRRSKHRPVRRPPRCGAAQRAVGRRCVAPPASRALPVVRCGHPPAAGGLARAAPAAEGRQLRSAVRPARPHGHARRRGRRAAKRRCRPRRRRDHDLRAGRPRPRSSAFLLSATGRGLDRSAVSKTLRTITAVLGLLTETTRPRAHDLRHSFAVRTRLDWQRSGARIDARIAALSTYLGHARPAGTYMRRVL